MKLIDNYIGTTVLVNILLVLFSLLALFAFFGFIEELQDVGKGNYSAGAALEYTMLSLPRSLYELFPIAGLLGSIIGLGTLAGSSELTVIRAAGVSLRRITYAVMKVGLTLIVIATLIGEIVAPAADKVAQVTRSVAISQKLSYEKKLGLWARDGASFINIREILAGERLGGISVFDFSEQKHLKQIVYAQEARYSGGRWLLSGVTISDFSPTQVITTSLRETTWNTALSPDLLDVVAVKPTTLTLLGLIQYVNYLQENGLNAGRYQLALWNKLVAPVIAAVMIFLAIPFVFGPLRSVGVGQRILVGSLVGIGFHLFNRVFNYLTLVFEFEPILSAITPTVVFAFIAVVLMKRVY